MNGRTGIINKPGTVELLLAEGKTVEIPCTVLTQVKPLTSSEWLITGRSYDVFAAPTKRKSHLNETAPKK